MERLSHDLNLALEESNCGKQGRRKFGFRRRTRSTGNLPASCLAGVTEDGSSSSPPQPPIISQALSDSDDPQLNQLQQVGSKSRAAHFCPGGNIESDSFNENFSPTKPPNARRKRKFKKMAIEYAENSNGRVSPSLLVPSSQVNLVSNCSILNVQGPSSLSMINKKKRIFKHGCQDGYRSNMFSGKRKWSHRERSEVGEMRERSFSGGCTSKSYFFGKSSAKSYLDFKNSKKYLPIEKVPKFKEKLSLPAKSAAVKNGIESALQSINLASFSGKPSMPGSSCFNFVYRCPVTKQETPDLKKSSIKIATELPPFFVSSDRDGNWSHGHKSSKKQEKSHNGKNKSHHKSSQGQLRNPLQFDDPNAVMDCSVANELLSSSSLSSSDSEGVVTNDSDREGDDELTDWPGNEEISSFNKSLNLKVQRPPNMTANFKIMAPMTSKPVSKKDKFLPKQGLSSCKNKPETHKVETVDLGNDMQVGDDDTMMSDSGSVLDTYACSVTRSLSDPSGPTIAPQTSFTSFGDVKNAGLLNNNANEAFFHSFQAFQDKAKTSLNKDSEQFTPRSNFSLQKTSSSDLNLSEKSPQSDHCYSEHSLCFGTSEIREIRAGCRRVRDERPGFAILSAANEQLSRFLQNSCQEELKLPCFNNDQEERDKLVSLAKLYSLELSIEMGRPILRKTSNTTQSVRVEHTRLHRQKFLSEFKRRCYGDNACDDAQLLSSLSAVCCTSADTIPMDPHICAQSTSAGLNNFHPETYSSLAKSVTLEDLSVSQDYDQGFSEPPIGDSLEAGEAVNCGNLRDPTFSNDVMRPDLLAHIPKCSNVADSNSLDLGELD